MSPKELSDIRKKFRIIQYGQEPGNVSKTCRYFDISKETYYKWNKDYESEGESALINSKSCPENLKLRIAGEIEARIIHLRTTYYLGQLRI
ncbi:helix-turn-helix domain-containing protein [Chitinophaga nivalis]|uniref:Helix-turn-helix domain-containing protein n=1 Tax=Chitinophaga nivalis TaxID=2991709 RepID=A0ABT3IN50_9BACT|nr:helix-turn-helix domain-containing protein [Chitinophaga nivalis]MCW3464902.1 helix-turn-helix domain-containing protein [Chitinophaga nivalis]MCW3485407.1 helix-turn-helix domain-containing protein [Chitinophaga nivalis]